MLNGAYPDTERLKSITPIHADAFDKIILEEATEFTEDDFSQICLRQRGNSEFKKSVYLLFNPIFQKHWIFKRFFAIYEDQIDFNEELSILWEDEFKNISILKTTYEDNIFLGQEEIDTLEGLKYTSPYHYNVYCKGNFGILGERCLPGAKIQEFDVSKLNINELGVCIGVDFGFTNDPTAIMFTVYAEPMRNLYVFDEIYGKHLSEEAIVAKVNEKLRLYGITYYKAYCDNEPRTESRLNSLGFTVNKIGAKDPIIDGIFWLNQVNLIVHPRCVELEDELNLYTFLKDTEGVVTNKPIDKYNHCIDGLRYSQKDHMENNKYIGISRKF